MYKYKRGINELEKVKQIEYTLSDNLNTCLSMSGCLEIKKPYNGMYIKNGKIMLSNLIEKIEIKDKVYRCVNLNTSIQSISSNEYIKSIDLETNTFEYELGLLEYTKKIAFENMKDILCIEYVVKNKETKIAKFKIIPMITYRDLYTMKTSQMLRFNQRKLDAGTVINLSVTNQENIILKSKEMNWTKEPVFLSNIKHEYTDIDCKKEIFTEDLLLPGEFEISIKPNEEIKFNLYISSKDFEIEDVKNDNIFNEFKFKKDKIMSGIDEKYIELKKLAFSIENIDMDKNMVPSLPYKKVYNAQWVEKIGEATPYELSEDLDELIDIVRSIDGQYLTFGRVKDAMSVLINLRRYIKEIDNLQIQDDNIIKKIIQLKLWYVESVNRYLQSEKSEHIFVDFVRDIVYEVLNEENIKKYYKYIDITTLAYNAIKIYEYILNQLGREDAISYKAGVFVQKLIEEKFWCEDKRTLKSDLNETSVEVKVQVIYALSLSYPCLVGEKAIKLLDTIFKELYTPYGLREISRNSALNKGVIYPKYMAHFVKANLRQNGVTRASQKISYNLVKELIQDIDKYVNGGVKKVYNEKGIGIDSIGYDLLTNVELIRLYDMLT
jgi:hypothetical protein